MTSTQLREGLEIVGFILNPVAAFIADATIEHFVEKDTKKSLTGTTSNTTIDDEAWRREYAHVDEENGGTNWHPGDHTSPDAIPYSDLVYELAGYDRRAYGMLVDRWDPAHADGIHNQVDDLYSLKKANPTQYEVIETRAELGAASEDTGNKYKSHYAWEALLSSFRYVDSHPQVPISSEQIDVLSHAEGVKASIFSEVGGNPADSIIDEIDDALPSNVGDSIVNLGKTIIDDIKEILTYIFGQFGIDSSNVIWYVAIGTISLLVVNKGLNKIFDF